MTAKFELAQRLEVMDRKKEAIKIYQEMLKLNPNDNQGVRYELARLLLIFYRYDLFYKLHKKYIKEETAFWLYNYAYFVFKTHGTGKTSDEALKKAYMANKHVIGIMIGKEKMPDELKEYYSPGQPDEAAYYLMDNIEMWMKDKEMVRWVVNFRRKLDKN
jgi:tetratricopeptide (TPR) repeat protein